MADFTASSTNMLAMLAMLAAPIRLTAENPYRKKSAAPEHKSHGAANPRIAWRQLGYAEILLHSCTTKQSSGSMCPIVGTVTAGWRAESGNRGIVPETTRQSGISKDCGARSCWSASWLHTGMPLPRASSILDAGMLAAISPPGIIQENQQPSSKGRGERYA